MNLASIGSHVEFEALLKPEVKNNAIFFEIQPTASACCLGRCCSKGKSVPCDAVFPHEQGLVVQIGDDFLLNNTKPVTPPPQARELEVDRSDGVSVLGWTIPAKVFKALEHPWGAILILEEVILEDSKTDRGLVLALLVLPH